MKIDTERTIRTRPNPTCIVCGSEGVPLYEGLRDRLGDAPGTWNFKQCRKPDCGMIWLDPQPIEEDIAHAYREYYTHKTAPEPVRLEGRGLRQWLKTGYVAAKYKYDFPGVTPTQKLAGSIVFALVAGHTSTDYYLMHLRGDSQGRLIEIGFGGGRSLRTLRELGWEVEGVDFDPVAVSQARNDGILAHLGDLTDLELEDAAYDVVTMGHVIEHVFDPLAVLKEAHRILKPGGRLVLLTPNTASLNHRRFGANWVSLDPPRHLNLFRPSSMELLARRAGFDHVAISTTGRDWGFISTRSTDIRRTGHASMESHSNSPADNLLHRLIRPIVLGAAKLRLHIGDELLLVAQK